MKSFLYLCARLLYPQAHAAHTPYTPHTMKLKIKNPLAIAITIVVCAVTILLTMPDNSDSFNYKYVEGEPWRYEQLIAPYEFPITKSHEQTAHEKDSVLGEFAPFFNFVAGTGQQQISNLKADYTKGSYGRLPHKYMDRAVQLLDEIYQHGIVDSHSLEHISKNTSATIRVVNGTSATQRPASEIYTARSAYQHIVNSDPQNFHPDSMKRLMLNTYIEPNLVYDSARSSVARKEALSTIVELIGNVQQGERIIDHGELITREKYTILESLKRAQEKPENQHSDKNLVLLGQIGLVLILLGLLLLYLSLFRKDLFESSNAIYLLFFTITFFSVISFVFVKYQFFSVYMIPFAMAPIFFRVFMDTRTAFMAHTVMTLLASLPLQTSYLFVLTQLAAGLVAIYSLRDLTERAQLFKTAAYVTVVTCAIGFCFELLQGTPLQEINTSWYTYIVMNGVCLLFAYPLLYLIERLFGFTSTVTLIELSNTNSPILRRMSKEAQGTFVHSMQVGNLAAEVAAKIGAKAQLVRTGALYHDIGKMINPAFFTENQSSVNPHDALTEERSAEIIISHVSEGLRLADKNFLPKVIRDFILTHHGASMVKYFYIQSCNKNGEANVDPALFTYPGKNPFTREQAILMMADAVEAASRSLKEYTEESIANLVDKIIDGQVADGYFRECPITFRDIADAKRVFTDSLKTIYHTRVAYPEKRQEGPAKPVETKPEAQPSRLFGSNSWSWRKN